MSIVPEAGPPAGLPERGGHAVDDVLRASSVLVVDDEPGMRNFLQRAFTGTCASVHVAGSVEEGEELRRRQHFDLMILDIRLPGLSGMQWLQSLREQGCNTDVIFITAYADLEMAIDALRAGASDFIIKPFRLEQINTAVKRCLERRRIVRENILLRRQVDRLSRPEGIIGESPAIKATCEVLQRVSPSSSTVLIEGETGTGKELVARAIHTLSGRRGPFVALNCGSISRDLIESELFGHTKGAFTGAVSTREGLFQFARDGTLFLDEIGEMPAAMQAKLLRVLEEKRARPVGAEREVPVNARVIAATNRHLIDDVRAGKFRQDLYYRLEVVTIRVPSLSERKEDIPALADHFIHSVAAELGVEPLPLTHGDIVQLQEYTWPGNVRELKNVIERYLLLGQLPQDMLDASPHRGRAEQHDTSAAYPLEWPLADVEKTHIMRVLDSTGGNKSEAARRLGISRKTLERKIHLWQRTEASNSG